MPGYRFIEVRPLSLRLKRFGASPSFCGKSTCPACETETGHFHFGQPPCFRGGAPRGQRTFFHLVAIGRTGRLSRWLVAMNTRDLIDGIVQQTTVLIAQISTAAGIRAPLAHLADQVFIELAREIEAQGVGRKIVADMFGLALRSYQKKVRRLSEGVTFKGRSLWEAVFDYVRENGSVSRRQVLQRFARDPEEHVRAVLTDLVGSGLAYSTGRGNSALFGVTAEHDQRALAADDSFEALTQLVWLSVYRARSLPRAALKESLSHDAAAIDRAVDALVADGRLLCRLEAGTEILSSELLTIPVGAEQGWESAVLDHFRAMCSGISTKLRRSRPRSASDDLIGGATLSFDIEPGHPHAEAVLGLLRRVRAEVNALWNEVTEYNRNHPVGEDNLSRVYFYFGQTVEDGDVPETENHGDDLV
jgi:hypothetical protein